MPSQASAPRPRVAEDACSRPTYIEEEEGATNRYRGWLARLATVLLVGMSLFHLYAAVEIVPAQVLRPVHVGWTLLLVFLLFPIAARYRNRLMWWDVVCAALGVATIVYLLAGGDDILGPQHAAEPRRRLLRRRPSCCSCWRRCGARRAGSCCS